MAGSLQLWNVNWLNANGQRPYPFAEHATRLDTLNSIKIPDSFLVECHLPIAALPNIEVDKFFLRRLSIAGGGYILEFAYYDGTGDPPIVATAGVSETGFTTNKAFNLIGSGDFEDTRGTVTVGRLEDIRTLPAGVYTFDLAATVLDPDCIRPIIRGVSSIAIEQGGVRSARYREHILISNGPGIRLSASSSTPGVTEIRIDAIPGEGFTEQCACEETLPDPIRSINGVTGDADKNITLLVDDCLRLTAGASSLKLEDICSKPCCGDDQLLEVVRVLDELRGMVTTTDGFASRLYAAIQNALINMVGARLSDRPCGS